MNWKAIGVASVLALTSCSSSQDAAPSLYGNWLYTNAAGTSGIGATFKKDGTYVWTTLALTSQTSGNAEIETGTFRATGSTIVFTPQQYSCPGPYPPITWKYTLSSSALVFSFPTGAISMKPNNEPASDSFTVVFGCFAKDGSFTKRELTPVTN